MKRKIYLAICCIFGAVFILSSVMLGVTLYGYRQADILYDDLQSRFVTPVTQGSEKPPSTKPGTSKPANTDITGTDPDATTIPDDTQTPIDKPNLPTSAPIEVNFEALLKENRDIIGWIYCENTVINYPVVQSGDNDYYLRRNLKGKYLVAGTLFADYRCSPIGTCQNFIIYGHNMKNLTMFGTLQKYKSQSYYDEHPVIWYLTPDKTYMLELFAGMITSADSKVYRTNYGSLENFDSFLQEILSKSTFKSNVSVTKEDHIVTLSTCSYEFGNARYVVFGKLTCISDRS